MENKKLEELFKNKLDGMVIEPSEASQDVLNRKIQLLKQKTLVRKISVAASVLLVVMAGIYAFLPNKNEKKEAYQQHELPINDHGDQLVEVEFFDSPDIDRSEKNISIQEDYIREESPTATSGDRTDNLDTDNTVREQLASGNEALRPEETLLASEFQEQEVDEMMTGQVEENVYIEYYMKEADSGRLVEESKHEPMKITIEYIASGDKKEESQSKLKEFYSKMDNMKGVDEVIGDFRSYKDRLFALDFKNNKKVNNEE
jgi:hypothetical protein